MNPTSGANTPHRPFRAAHAITPATRQAVGPAAGASQPMSTRATPRPIDPAEMERLMSRIPIVDQPTPPIDLSGLPGMDRLMNIDGERVARSAAYTAAAVGMAFAATFPAANVMRAASSHPAAKVAAGLLPAVGGAMTAVMEPWLAEAMGHRPTAPREPALWHDAINPGTLFATIAACQRAPLPKFPATSLPGAVIASGVSIAGAYLGGAAAEAAAQATHHDQPPVEDAPQPGVAAKALGRAASLLPYAAYMGMAVLRPAVAMTPPRPSLTPAAVATGGWAFRNVLTPEPTAPTTSPPTAQEGLRA